MTDQPKRPLLIAVFLSFALVASACAPKEPEEGVVTTRRITTTVPTTAEPPPDPREVIVPECDDSDECVEGFVLAEVFYSVSCIAIKEDFVTSETLGSGDYLGDEVTVNIVEGVNPSRFVALSVPGGQCASGDEATSPWSIAFEGQPSAADTSFICAVGLLTEQQLVTNACVDQLIPISGGGLSAEDVEGADAVMSEFFAALPTNNAGAGEFWSGYPTPGSRNTLFNRFVRDFGWMKTRDVRWEIVPAAGDSGHTVAIVTDDSDQGGSFVVSPSTEAGPGIIQRLPEPSALRFTPKDRSVIPGGFTVVFRGTVSRDVKAYLGSVELTELTINRNAGTVSVVLPEVLPPLVVITFVSETSEVPRAATAVYFFRPD